MRNRTRAAALAIGLAALAAPLAAQTSITIYNDGRILVRRTVPAEVDRGISAVRLPLGALDLSTLFALDSSVAIVSARYDGATDYPSVLRRAVGRTLKFRYGNDTVTATVAGVDPERYRLPDGSIIFDAPGRPIFPADLVVIDPVTELTLRSRRAGRSLDLGYFSAGASWQASYQVILGRGGRAGITGSAVISSNAFKADSAEVQLLAGSVNRAPSVRDQGAAKRMLAGNIVASEAVAVGEQRVGEFHLYSLSGRQTIRPGIDASVALFDPASSTYDRRYVVHGSVPYYGVLQQYGDEQDVPVEVWYSVKRPRKTDFGDRPLPGGVVRLFQPDSAGRLQLIGESGLSHTPAGQDLELAAGTAFDLTAKRVQATYSVRRDSSRTTAFADYRVTLTNATDSTVTVEVQEERGGDWAVIQSSLPAEKVSSTVTRFRVRVPADGEATLTYRVRVRW
ncbi:MAG: DUF4139 domain-containing protein [Gemmatimonadales bacterium]